MTKNFVHLHLHTEYSLLDGVGKIDEYIAQAKKFNMPAIAITDHGNMFGAYQFYQSAIKAGIKPIIGIEIYVSEFMHTEKKGENFHLVLLAKDLEGYKNLLKLASLGYTEGFYYKPRVDKAQLKRHANGLIALSACLKGEIPYYLMQSGIEKATESLNAYCDIFGKDNFYLELQNTHIFEQIKLNESLIALSTAHDISCVITNDVHYVYNGDHHLQDIVVCIQTGSKLSDTSRFKIDTDALYFKSPSEMHALFSDSIYQQALSNSIEIANRCNLVLDDHTLKFPNYVPEKFSGSLEEFLKKLVLKYTANRYPEPLEKTVQERIEYELDVIIKMGYAGYFIVVWDLINYARTQNIPIGPGRGSAAGSIIAYILRITEVDPLKYDLVFERFLNPERISMPDIDIDICQERRHEIIDYVVQKYGADHVAQIITFGTLKAKAAIRDVGRVMGISLGKIDSITKNISSFQPLAQALKDNPFVSKLYDEDIEIKKLFNFAMRIEGKVRHASTHAAGIVISKHPLSNDVPLYRDSKESSTTTQYQMKELEDIGLLKMDFLGLKNLTIIQRTREYILTYQHKDVILSEIPLDDLKTFELFQKGDTVGIFQFESKGITNLTQKVHPNCFEDIIALLALYRPGPLGSGMVDDFIDYKNGTKPLVLPDKRLKSVLLETYGVILYQEQVMKIAHIMADYTLGEADLLRRAMSKKSSDIMEENRVRFVSRAEKKGYSTEKATGIFFLIEQFAGYGFNKAHSASYALIAYWTAYFKANYPLEFFSAIMSSEKHDSSKLAHFIDNARKNDIHVSPPDINLSENNFIIHENSIVFSLSAIKNIGEILVEKLVHARSIQENHRFNTFNDFIYLSKKEGLNKKALEALIFSGSLTCFNYNKSSLFHAIDSSLDYANKRIAYEDDFQLSLFGKKSSTYTLSIQDMSEMPQEELLKLEKEFLGLYLSGHPLDRFKLLIHYMAIEPIHTLSVTSSSNIQIFGVIQGIKHKVTKKGEVMSDFVLEDFSGEISTVVFPKTYLRYSHLLSNGQHILAKGYISQDFFGGKESVKFILNSLIDLNEFFHSNNYRIYLLTSENTEIAEALKAILVKHKGSFPITLAFKETKKLLPLPKLYHITPTQTCLEEITALLGEKSVKIQQIKY